MNPRPLLSLAALLSLGLGSEQAAAQRPAQFPLPTQTVRYRVEGTVIALQPGSRQLVIDAKAIPGYMAASVVPFALRDTAVFSQVRPGDYVAGDIVVMSGASWLENVTTTTPSGVVAGPFVDTTAVTRRDSARPPKDSIGIRPPPVDSVLKPNTMRDSTALRYPPR